MSKPRGPNCKRPFPSQKRRRFNIRQGGTKGTDRGGGGGGVGGSKELEGEAGKTGRMGVNKT